MKALVTGAGRGIGRAVAVELIGRGIDVVAGMRDPSQGTDLDCEVIELDVRSPGELPDVDILVNNAGVDLDHVPVEHADLDLWRDMFETNVIGLVAVTRAVLPGMRSRGSGVICCVSSSSILVPVPFYAGYRASKAAVGAVCDSLRTEVADRGIRVHEILPGPIDTDMWTESRGEHPAAAYAEYRDQAIAAQEASGSVVEMLTTAADAARVIVDVIVGDDPTMRHGCDPMSVGLLDAWRTMSDEALFAMVSPTA